MQGRSCSSRLALLHFPKLPFQPGGAMKRIAYLLLMVLPLALLSGCGGDKDRGMNRHKDLPRAAPTESNK
jgi:hypothetical protein